MENGGSNEIPEDTNEHCPGPQSESARKSDVCEGCPNQEVCATAPKGPDPVLFPLYYYYQKHPYNYIFLGVFKVSLAVVVGLACAFTKAKRGHDFNFLGSFLFGSLMVLMFEFIQLLFPLGKVFVMVYGFLASLSFCGYIIYDTDNLIKRYSYDEYI